MRKLFILIFTLSLTIGLKAQDNPLPRSFNFKKFDLNSAYLTIPRLQFNEITRNNLSQNDDWSNEYLRNPSESIEKIPQQFLAKKGNNMPVYHPALAARMPIQVPDSTVKYHIKIKDFSMDNFENRILE